MDSPGDFEVPDADLADSYSGEDESGQPEGLAGSDPSSMSDLGPLAIENVLRDPLRDWETPTPLVPKTDASSLDPLNQSVRSNGVSGSEILQGDASAGVQNSTPASLQFDSQYYQTLLLNPANLGPTIRAAPPGSLYQNAIEAVERREFSRQLDFATVRFFEVVDKGIQYALREVASAVIPALDVATRVGVIAAADVAASTVAGVAVGLFQSKDTAPAYLDEIPEASSPTIDPSISMSPTIRIP